MPPADEATQIPASDSQDPQTATSAPTSDPPEKDWKEEYARLRKDYDNKASRLKDLEKPKSSEKPATPDDEELDFRIENAERVKTVKDEFKAYKAKGYSNADSLRLAELDKGITVVAKDAQRQAATASAPAFTNRSASLTDTVQLTETDARLGVKAETKMKYRQLVEGE